MKAHADLAGFELMIPGSLNEPKIMLGHGSLPLLENRQSLELVYPDKTVKIRD